MEASTFADFISHDYHSPRPHDRLAGAEDQETLGRLRPEDHLDRRCGETRRCHPRFHRQGHLHRPRLDEWTQGFVYGSAILQYDATGDESFLTLGRDRTRERMAHHITHIGVHDHGFNNVSTYGNLLRLMVEGRIAFNQQEKDFYELALKCTGAVQAARWSRIANGEGYIYSFNGPHSLFADTIRSLRALAVSHQLGHVLMGERDARISLLERLIQHARTTSQFAVFFGEGRDYYDERGRVATRAYLI